MPKGDQRSNREKKKPKQPKPPGGKPAPGGLAPMRPGFPMPGKKG